MLGQKVTVKVDRPMGSYHPEHKDMYYPINYGYVAPQNMTFSVDEIERQVHFQEQYFKSEIRV